MAIEIIKRGKHPKQQRLQGQCRNCSTQIRCLREDVEYTRSMRNEPEDEYVKCPVCEHYIYNLQPVPEARTKPIGIEDLK